MLHSYVRVYSLSIVKTRLYGDSVKAYCNVDLVGRSDESIKFLYFLPKSQAVYKVNSLFLFLRALLKSDLDCVLIFNANLFYMIASFLYRLSGGKAKIIYFDVLLKLPVGIKQRIIAKIKSLFMRSVDCFFSVHKDLSDYSKYYGIASSRSYYIPFKANNFEIRASYPLSDEGYVLSCGVSHRDYKSLFEAVEGLDVKVKVVLPDSHNIQFHKTLVDFAHIPKNVEIVTHDFNKDSWNKILSGAKFVVIPISKDSIQPSGISVYLESMMFKKPVIISKGPSTKSLIDSGQSLVVERGSVEALRSAIQLLNTDDQLRNKYAVAGYNYAIELQGVDRLIGDIKIGLLSLR